MNIDKTVEEVIKRVKEQNIDDTIEVEASGRHVHLSQEHLEILFGKGFALTKKKELSQPGEFLSGEKVNVIGPKGILNGVSILGPVRKQSQVEVSLTDTRILGTKAVIRESGNIEGTPAIVLMSDKACLRLDNGLIVAKRHIHLTPEDAEYFQVKNGDLIGVKVETERSATLNDVVVRISEKYCSKIHIDYDEANAIDFKAGMSGKIIR